MAAVIAGVSAANTGNNAALTTGTFTTAAGDLLVAFAVVSGQASGGTFTDNEGGSGWTTVSTALKNTSADTLVFGVKNGFDDGSASRTVTFTPAGSPTASGVAISVLRVSGMTRAGLDAVRTVGATKQVGTQANQAGGGTPAPALPANCLTGNPTVGAVGNGANPANISPNSLWVERHDTGYNTPANGIETNSRDSGFTGTTVTYIGTSGTAFASIVAELDTSVPVLEEDEPVVHQIPDVRTVTVWG